MEKARLGFPEPDHIRNIGVLAHVDAGKTSITERILYLAGLRREAGDVDKGTTATDYLSVERRHGITVKSAAVRFDWKGTAIRLIDTPGHVDFGIEVERALRILDGAVIALCAVSGVQARTEVIARACADRFLPRLYFVNKMDREGADFPGVVQHLRSDLEPKARAVQFPLYEGRKWVGIVDLLSGEMLRFDGEGGLPESCGSAIEKERADLVESLAECDERIMALFAANKAVPSGLFSQALSAASKRGDLIPVLCGSAFIGESVALLLDAVLSDLPSVAEAAIPGNLYPSAGHDPVLAPDSKAPLAAFVFKTLADESGDIFAWTRIWSGSIRAGRKFFDARSGKDILVRKFFGIHADELIELAEAGPGEIVALKVQTIEPGATLCGRQAPVLFENFSIPEPVISQVVEPASAEELALLRKALESLSVEDSSLLVKEEKETGRFLVSGQGELHLGIVAERLKREFGLGVRLGNPRINCKERLKRQVTAREVFDRDFGGERIRTIVELRLGPEMKGEGFSVVPADNVRIPPQYLASALRGALASASTGPFEGWPLESLQAVIVDLVPPAAGTGRNGETAVEAAAALAARKALVEAGSILLEPVMAVDIECSEESFGALLSAIVSRKGRVESVEDRLSIKAISAKAPMSSLIGFAGELRSISRGKAHFQARFEAYEPVKRGSEA
ncbi:MAG: GTP-binding protein [Spirochaetes bacterium]|nr:GTP-binding protein [Spirochaetota bacterium]